MKIIFESDGTAEDLARILQVLQKLASPTVDPITRLDNLETREEATAKGPPAAPNYVQNPPVKAKREYQKRGSKKEDPPQAKERKGRKQNKPDPLKIVKLGWQVKGPWKEGGKDNPYRALHVYSPDGKQHYKYVVGKTKAGYQGLTDADVKKLQLQSGMAELRLPAGSDPIPKVSIRPGEEIPGEPLKELPKDNKSTACQICLNRGRPLGCCEKMGSAHCYPCHSRSHGDVLYDWKAF